MRKIGGRRLPTGWPDPLTLLRDPKWEENYPTILLRGIFNVMAREKKGTKSKKKPTSGDFEHRYKAGFNMSVWSLTNATPPRFRPDLIKKGILDLSVLTSIGKEREAEVLGLRGLSPKSRRKYGNKSRADMKRDTYRKMIELRKLLDMVRSTTAEEGMPPAHSSATRP